MNDRLSAPLAQLLQDWIHGQQQPFLEKVLGAWQEAADAFVSDEKVINQLQSLVAPEPAPLDALPMADVEGDLGAALTLLEEAPSQGEVLKRLLEGLMPFVERSALFVIKQGIASLYAIKGYEAESPRMGSPVVPPPELESLITGTAWALDKPELAYRALLGPISRFEASDFRIHPLRLRRKTVALLLVDSGLRQVVDHPQLVRALAHAAEAALAYLSGLKEDERTRVDTSPSMATQRLVEPIPETAVPALDPKVRTNAERSARVLVGDIELYFPAKVEQGRQRGGLYTLLKDELDRSRASFVERYGLEVEEHHHIFFQTVVQQLCMGDRSLLGDAPWAPKG